MELSTDNIVHVQRAPAAVCWGSCDGVTAGVELVTKTKTMGHSAQEARREAETKHDTTEMNPQDFGAAGPVVSFVSDF